LLNNTFCNNKNLFIETTTKIKERLICVRVILIKLTIIIKYDSFRCLLKLQKQKKKEKLRIEKLN
jgi:hypothetical protein